MIRAPACPCCFQDCIELHLYRWHPQPHDLPELYIHLMTAQTADKDVLHCCCLSRIPEAWIRSWISRATIKRREQMEAQLAEIEADIRTLEQGDIVLVVPDDTGF